jgi:glycine hydroxymethyltransferase
MIDASLLTQADPVLAQMLRQEERRQEDHIELIASENYVSLGVMALQGSVLTNKYAEGYPGKRYYGGCEHVDAIESLAISRARDLFGADFVNVQPHSGSGANMAVYMALCEPGDTVLAMDLNAGGHLTHGSSVNFSGKLYAIIPYGVDEQTGLIDYDAIERLAHLHKPKLIIAGFSAYSRIVDWERIGNIAKQVGAYSLADIAHVAGLVAVGLYPSPVPYVDVVTTTTHKTLRGPRSGMIMGRHNEAIAKKINSAIFPGIQGGPLEHVIAAKALAFKEASEPAFKAYQAQVLRNAKVMAEVFISRGYPIVSGGTDNHLLLLDLKDKPLTGKEAESILAKANITVNKNTVPGETRSPFVTSGIRIGTPAVTTRGFKEAQCQEVAQMICDLLDAPSDDGKCSAVANRVQALTQAFPVYTSFKG